MRGEFIPWRLEIGELHNSRGLDSQNMRFLCSMLCMFDMSSLLFFGPLYLQYCLETMCFSYFPPGMISRSKSWCS